MDFKQYITDCKHRIDEVLTAFNIQHDGIAASPGPTVTLFEFKPKVGTRTSKVTNLRSEFAIQLGVPSVRVIAPTYRGTVGIEVPNRERIVIPMTDMLYTDEYMSTEMTLPLCLGRKADCSVFMADLATLPHLLVAGATGMGKSVGLNVIISSLINKLSPEELKFVLIDPKQVEFTLYEKIERPYLLKLYPDSPPIVTDTKDAIDTLAALCDIMDERYTLLKEASVRNIAEYNAAVSAASPAEKQKLPYIVLVIDEFADIMLTSRQSKALLEEHICRIAQKARAVGIHAIIATQRPSTEFVTGCVKANFPARLSFRTTTAIDSRVILDHKGAESLTGLGDFLFYNGGDTIRAQCAYISTQEVSQLCTDLQDEYSSLPVSYLKERPKPKPPIWETYQFDHVLPETVQFLQQKDSEDWHWWLHDKAEDYFPDKNVLAQLIEMGLVRRTTFSDGAVRYYTTDCCPNDLKRKAVLAHFYDKDVSNLDATTRIFIKRL